MPSLGPAEILVILVVALLIFGPDKMPDIARQVGRGFREFRRVQNHLKAELRDVVSEFDSTDVSTASPAPTTSPAPPTDVSADEWAKENTGTPVPAATGDPLPSLPPLETGAPEAVAAMPAMPPMPPAEVALPPAEVALPPADVALPPAEVALPPAEPPAANA